MKKHIVVGLTGGFGTGKSTAAGMFQELGAWIIDADRIAHEALRKESPVYGEISKLFPEAVTSGDLDRKKIAAVVFNQPEKKKKIELLVHPYVFERMEQEISEAEETVVVLDVPLLFETGLDQRCDLVCVVDAPETAVRERLKERGFTEKEIDARKKAQMPLEEKKKKANFIINNSQDLEQTKQDVEKIWKGLHLVSKGDK